MRYIIVLLLLLAAPAAAQQVPHPVAGGPPTVVSWNNNILGSAITGVGNNIAPYTTDAAFIKFHTKPSMNNVGLYGLPQYSVVETRVDVPAGTTVQNVSGFASYVRNSNPSGGESGNAVGFTAVTNAMVNNSQTWGFNSVNNTSDPAGTGKVLSGYEADFGAASPNDEIRGIGIYGNTSVAFAPTTSVRALVIGQLSTQNPGLARWKQGVLCDVASFETGGACLHIEPHDFVGSNVGGPSVAWWFRDDTGTRQYYSLRAHNDNNLIFDSSKHAANIGVRFQVPTQHTEAINLRPLQASGASIASPNLNFLYWGADAAAHSYGMGTGSDGDFNFNSDLNTTNRYSFNIGVRFNGAINVPTLASGIGPGVLVCINNLNGQLYKSAAGAC